MSPSFEEQRQEEELRKAEAELSRRLQEACESDDGGPSDETIAELKRLEDSLLKAARAAQRAIELRREMGEGAGTGGPRLERDEPATSGEPRGDLPPAVRDFMDEQQREWLVWAVTPGGSPGRDTRRYLGEFHKGWLVFEATDGSSRRRLLDFPKDWWERPDAELRRLLASARESPRRTPRSGQLLDRLPNVQSGG